MIKRTARYLAVIIAAGTTLATMCTGTANAVTYKYGECYKDASGWCDTFDTLTLFYNSNQGGCSSSFIGKIDDYTTSSVVYVFGGTYPVFGNGYGYAVKNNAASGFVDGNYNYKIFYNNHQGGPSQSILANGWANLNSTLKNENASQDYYS